MLKQGITNMNSKAIEWLLVPGEIVSAALLMGIYLKDG